jgi:plastocyanin
MHQAAAPPRPPTKVGFRSDFDPIIATNKIEMVDFSFVTNPGVAFATSRNKVRMGTRVTWVNLGTQPHTATDAGVFLPACSRSAARSAWGPRPDRLRPRPRTTRYH